MILLTKLIREHHLEQINTITFDLWQTLLLEDGKLGRLRAQLRIDGIREVLGNADREFPDDKLWDAYQRCAFNCDQIRSTGKDIGFRGQVSIFMDFLDPRLQEDLTLDAINEIRDAYDLAFLEYPPRVDPSALSVLKRLREKGYQLGLISNTGMTPGRTCRIYLDRLGILDQFQVLVFSDEVLLAKPSPRIFRLAVASLGTSPRQTVHVGDDFQRDVKGAKDSGMKAIWLSHGVVDGIQSGSSGVVPDGMIKNLNDVVDVIRGLHGEVEAP